MVFFALKLVYHESNDKRNREIEHDIIKTQKQGVSESTPENGGREKPFEIIKPYEGNICSESIISKSKSQSQHRQILE